MGPDYSANLKRELAVLSISLKKDDICLGTKR